MKPMATVNPAVQLFAVAGVQRLKDVLYGGNLEIIAFASQ
jgi:hypothetical protein